MAKLDHDALIAVARQFVPAKFGLDMCRHESVTEPTFWIFDGQSQIGCAAHEPENALPWRGSRMFRGMATGQARFPSIDGALRYACTRPGRG